VRLQQHYRNGLEIGEWLRSRPEVRQVLHPALPDTSGYALWKRDFLGASGLFGIELEPCSENAIAAMLDGMQIFHMGYSWGGYESLIVPTNVRSIRTATSWNFEGPLVRLHVGLESVSDLKDDLAEGFQRLRGAG
jgi:cystathionine beta-lyase